MAEDVIEFRLHSEGSNGHPSWGIAFRHKSDVKRLLDLEPAKRPVAIDIEFPDGSLYKFVIRPCFWTGCLEFVDARVVGGAHPVRTWAVNRLGYAVGTKRNCRIAGTVTKRNGKLKLLVFQ